ncbi:hypothetical protein BV22DRAFT_1036572 [Leucogyrophana mollusca]|uniref:Uncharacterized protein n=1 Tax=Leucogyrophana mollusca TaxID=85980 RepID=A0ACB8BD82_9AGAM|nr:hypothetical protein BV22DRAFT_1036572 [Leucogyrophana mollusca]
MFTVKATYRSETRKFTFPEKVLFPTYDELYHQLYRVFPISHNYYFSKLIFSPDASKPSRILIGKEVHSAEEYSTCVAPLRRSWPNALLRFSVFDETPHKAPSIVADVFKMSGNLPPPVPSSAFHGFMSGSTFSGVASEVHPVVLPSHIPPPPIILSSPPFQRIQAPSPMDVDATKNANCGSRSNSSPQSPSYQRAYCCSIEKGKAEIESLLSTFKEDLDRVIQDTFGPNSKHDVAPPSDAGSQVIPPPQSATPSMQPHSPYQPVYISPSTSPSNWCFVCRTNFSGFWYGCVKCSWHAVCPGCFKKSGPTHTFSFGPSHVVEQRSPNGFVPSPSMPLITSLQPETPVAAVLPEPAVLSTPESEPVVHRGIICDKCEKIIVGVRHKCLDCPDYDLCSPCIDSGFAEKHNPFHEFFDIETPGRIFVHTVFSGQGERETSPQEPRRSSPSNTGDTIRRSALHQEVPANHADEPVIHNATCNLCDSRIAGDRYKCVNCPDFDTCSSCFKITAEQHPNHGFVKVQKTEDLMMRNALAGDSMSHYATCDSCNLTICGVRYKCMHPNCPDFDLCSACEALPIPVHPPIHPMLKMKTPDTVVPTVYRVGRTALINSTREAQMEMPDCNAETGLSVRGRPHVRFDLPASLPPSSPTSRSQSPAIQTPVAAADSFPVSVGPPQETHLVPPSPSVEPSNVLSANVTCESPKPSGALSQCDISPPTSVPSLAASATGFTLPPLSLDPTHDVFRELWPRVNQEMKHLVDVTEAQPRLDHESLSTGTIHTDNRPGLDHLNTEAKLVDFEESPLTREALLATPAAPFVAPEMIQRDMTPIVSVNRSLAALLNGYRTPSPATSVTSGPAALHNDCSSTLDADDNQPTDRREPILSSAFVADTTVPDGQIFPPGAEFVKSWRMLNDGADAWPETTELHFVAGESFAPGLNTDLKANVGRVDPGEELDVWTGELKAPDAPGRYVSYWRLSNGKGGSFGSSVWIDVTVAEHHSDDASEHSLASSAVVMPGGAPNRTSAPSVTVDYGQLATPLELSSLDSKPMADATDDGDSDGSSVSLVSIPSSDDDDSAEWQDSRSHVEPLEYVVLYDSNSSEEE